MPPPLINHVSGEYLVHNGIRTFACSETQKFGHVTFFWNGNRSGYFDEKLETYVEIPSDNVAFNTKPLMKAKEITEAGKEALTSGRRGTGSREPCLVLLRTPRSRWPPGAPLDRASSQWLTPASPPVCIPAGTT